MGPEGCGAAAGTAPSVGTLAGKSSNSGAGAAAPALGRLGDSGPAVPLPASAAAVSRLSCCLYSSAARLVNLASVAARSPAAQPCCAKKARARALPPLTTKRASCSCVHLSIVALRTSEMWTPSPRCTPAQSRHSSTPNGTLVHFGFDVPQSKHARLSALLIRRLNTASLSSWEVTSDDIVRAARRAPSGGRGRS